ncbi:MAG: hypothetical protein GDA50_08785 [Alphaproteobacteria bacterium GM202ARS2]|nr:hypothetical protein [Alphaproteobacteria bacterium GM202ARS2]
MARRHVLLETPMRPFFSVVEDYDFVLRCAETYTLVRIPDFLYHYRMADNKHDSLSTSDKKYITIWHYHLVAWLSSYYRRNNMADPINHKTIENILSDARPILKNLASYPRRKLFISRSTRALSLSLQHNDLHMCRMTLALVLTYSTYSNLCHAIVRLLLRSMRYPYRVALYREIACALIFPRLFVAKTNPHMTP